MLYKKVITDAEQSLPLEKTELNTNLVPFINHQGTLPDYLQVKLSQGSILQKLLPNSDETEAAKKAHILYLPIRNMYEEKIRTIKRVRTNEEDITIVQARLDIIAKHIQDAFDHNINLNDNKHLQNLAKEITADIFEIKTASCKTFLKKNPAVLGTILSLIKLANDARHALQSDCTPQDKLLSMILISTLTDNNLLALKEVIPDGLEASDIEHFFVQLGFTKLWDEYTKYLTIENFGMINPELGGAEDIISAGLLGEKYLSFIQHTSDLNFGDPVTEMLNKKSAEMIYDVTQQYFESCPALAKRYIQVLSAEYYEEQMHQALARLAAIREGKIKTTAKEEQILNNQIKILQTMFLIYSTCPQDYKLNTLVSFFENKDKQGFITHLSAHYDGMILTEIGEPDIFNILCIVNPGQSIFEKSISRDEIITIRLEAAEQKKKWKQTITELSRVEKQVHKQYDYNVFGLCISVKDVNVIPKRKTYLEDIHDNGIIYLNNLSNPESLISRIDEKAEKSKINIAEKEAYKDLLFSSAMSALASAALSGLITLFAGMVVPNIFQLLHLVWWNCLSILSGLIFIPFMAFVIRNFLENIGDILSSFNYLKKRFTSNIHSKNAFFLQQKKEAYFKNPYEFYKDKKYAYSNTPCYLLKKYDNYYLLRLDNGNFSDIIFTAKDISDLNAQKTGTEEILISEERSHTVESEWYGGSGPSSTITEKVVDSPAEYGTRHYCTTEDIKLAQKIFNKYTREIQLIIIDRIDPELAKEITIKK
jgi:hypothetical protein